MKNRKIITTIITTIFVCTLFAGCNNPPVTTEEATEPTEATSSVTSETTEESVETTEATEETTTETTAETRVDPVEDLDATLYGARAINIRIFPAFNAEAVGKTEIGAEYHVVGIWNDTYYIIEAEGIDGVEDGTALYVTKIALSDVEPEPAEDPDETTETTEPVETTAEATTTTTAAETTSNNGTAPAPTTAPEPTTATEATTPAPTEAPAPTATPTPEPEPEPEETVHIYAYCTADAYCNAGINGTDSYREFVVEGVTLYNASLGTNAVDDWRASFDTEEYIDDCVFEEMGGAGQVAGWSYYYINYRDFRDTP